MKLYNQLLLQGLAGIILRLTIVSVQRGTCAIIKVECCVYIPDLSGNISATLDDMKGQVKAMTDDNLPFWTFVLSWVKGDWWKTLLTIVIVVLLILLCGLCILQCVVNFVSQRLTSFTQIYTRKSKMQYIPMSDTHTGSWEHQEGVMKEERNRPSWLHLEKEVKSILYSQWILDYVPGSHGDHIPTAEQPSQTGRHQIPYQDFPSPERM